MEENSTPNLSAQGTTEQSTGSINTEPVLDNVGQLKENSPINNVPSRKKQSKSRQSSDSENENITFKKKLFAWKRIGTEKAREARKRGEFVPKPVKRRKKSEAARKQRQRRHSWGRNSF